MHCEGGLIVKLHSIDFNQLQVTHPDLSVIKEIAQINMRCTFLLGFIKMSGSKTGSLQMETQDIMY